MLCPVCGRKVGAWRKDGVHPKCADKMPVDVYAGGVKIGTLRQPAVLKLPDGDEYVIGKGFARLSQKQRDAILRRMNAKDR